MSYTKLDAMNDTNDMMVSALNSDDASYVLEIAEMLARVSGWEEEAQILKNKARKMNEGDWAYDESISN